MTLDIYDDLEHLVPAERRDAFLRLSRQIKEYGDHNPELLRLVEVMGLLEPLHQRSSETNCRRDRPWAGGLRGGEYGLC